MGTIFGEEENQLLLDTKFIEYSRFKNGYIRQWILNRYDLKIDVHSSFNSYEKFGLIFMFLTLIRVIKALTIDDLNDRIFMYFGSTWHYLSANYIHIEVTFLLWTTYFLILHIYVIDSPDQSYKWLEVYGFLTGIIHYKRIGNIVENV